MYSLHHKRFPLKDEARLQQWEEIVNRVKNYPNAWKGNKA